MDNNIGDVKEKFNFDLADFHGIESGVSRSEKSENKQRKPSENVSVYAAPDSELGTELDDRYYDEAKLSFGVIFFAILNIFIALVCFGFLFVVAYKLYSGWTFAVVYLPLPLYMLVAYIGVLAKKNWGRSMVVLMAFLKFFAFPIGTIEAIVVYRNLSGRRFKS